MSFVKNFAYTLLIVALTYWACGAYIVYISRDKTWTIEYQLETSLDWAWKFWIIKEYSPRFKSE
jgi:hypothetical protein